MGISTHTQTPVSYYQHIPLKELFGWAKVVNDHVKMINKKLKSKGR